MPRKMKDSTTAKLKQAGGPQSVKPPSRLFQRAKSLPKNFKLPKSLQPSGASIRRFINDVKKTYRYGVYGPGQGQAVNLAKGKGLGHELNELKPPKARPDAEKGAGVKETKFTVTRKHPVAVKSFGPKYDVYERLVKYDPRLQMDSIPVSQPPLGEGKFSAGMKAKASVRLSVNPASPPKYSTLSSINSGQALRQAYDASKPITALQKMLNGGAVNYPLGNIVAWPGNVQPIPSLGGQTITAEQLFKNIKGGVSTLDAMRTEAAIAKTRTFLMDKEGQITGSESLKDYARRLKETDKWIKSNEKAIKRVLKNAKNAVSKHIDQAFQQGLLNAPRGGIKTIRTELKGLRTELKGDLKRIQTMPVRSNAIELRELTAVKQPAPAHFDQYKPQSEADRALKFNQRWRDGHVEINRVEGNMNSELKRVNDLRNSKNLVKEKLKQDIQKLLNDSKAVGEGIKKETKWLKNQQSKEKALARAARLARMRKRMLRFFR